MEITSQKIRDQLKQFDSFFGFKPSKTRQLLDPVFQQITVPDFRWLVNESNRYIAEFFGVHPASVPLLWKQNSHDCDNFANQLVALSNMVWAKRAGETLQPAIFRIISKLPDTVHAYNMAFTDDGIWFADLTRGTNIWSIKEHKPNIIGFG